MFLYTSCFCIKYVPLPLFPDDICSSVEYEKKRRHRSMMGSCELGDSNAGAYEEQSLQCVSRAKIKCLCPSLRVRAPPEPIDDKGFGRIPGKRLKMMNASGET